MLQVHVLNTWQGVDGEKLFQATGECAKSTLSTLPKGGLAKPLDTLPWQRVLNPYHVLAAMTILHDGAAQPIRFPFLPIRRPGPRLPPDRPKKDNPTHELPQPINEFSHRPPPSSTSKSILQ